jgi:hypothetical protein
LSSFSFIVTVSVSFGASILLAFFIPFLLLSNFKAKDCIEQLPNLLHLVLFEYSAAVPIQDGKEESELLSVL